MLASGDSPVLPAHVPIAEQRTRCVGTGPFRLKEWKRGEYVDYVRNPDYFVKDRPYLDGIRYLVVTERSTRTAALQAGRADVASPGDGGPQIAEQLRGAVPGMVITRVGINFADHLLFNHTKPPFNDVRMRRALSLGMDRAGFVQAVLQGGGLPGSALAPPPDRALGAHGQGPVSRQRQGSRACAPRRGGLRTGQFPQARCGHPQPRDLPRRRRLRHGQPATDRRRGHSADGRDSPVVWVDHPARVPVRPRASRGTASTTPIRSSPRASSANRRGIIRATATRKWTSSSRSSHRSWTAGSARHSSCESRGRSRTTRRARSSPGGTTTSLTGRR